MAIQIPLTRGQFALIDEADLPLVEGIKWHAHPCQRRTGGFYAAGRKWRNGTIYMHRLLLGVSGREILVDHVNGDGLDNRGHNIRRATRSQNLINRLTPNPTGFRGVHVTRSGKWRARIMIHGKIVCSGTLDAADEAAAAYDELALLYHGDFAVLNFPHQSLGA